MRGIRGGTPLAPLTPMVPRAVVLALLLWGAAMAVLKLSGEVAYPLWIDYGEGISLDRVRALLQGEPIYTAVGERPYISWNFPPLYVWVCAGLARWFGASFTLGRAVSAIALLTAALVIYALARQAGASRRWAFLGSLAFLASPPVVAWGVPMRCDHLALALSLGGLWFAIARRAHLAAGIFFALAALSRQSSVAGFLAAVLWLMARREWRGVLSITVTWAGVVAGVLLSQSVASHGRIWANITVVNMNAYRVGWLVKVAWPAVASELPLLAVAACWLLMRPTRAGSPLIGYLGLASASVLLAGKIGSDWNYSLEFAAAASIAGAVGAAALSECIHHRFGTLGHEAPAALAFACYGCLAAGLPNVAAMLGDLPGRQHVTCLLAETPGPVIADEPGIVVAAGHRLWLQPFEYTQLAVAGRWDQTPLVQALRRGEFGAVVLHFDPWDERARMPDGTWSAGRFTDEMVRAIRAAYRVEQQWGRMRLLRPMRGATGRQAHPSERMATGQGRTAACARGGLTFP